MDRYRFGYHADLLAQYPTIRAAVAFALHIDDTSDGTVAQGILRAQQGATQGSCASRPH